MRLLLLLPLGWVEPPCPEVGPSPTLSEPGVFSTDARIAKHVELGTNSTGEKKKKIRIITTGREMSISEQWRSLTDISIATKQITPILSTDQFRYYFLGTQQV